MTESQQLLFKKILIYIFKMLHIFKTKMKKKYFNLPHNYLINQLHRYVMFN